MNSVLEIEIALRRLPQRDKWEIAHWLVEDLQEASIRHSEPQESEKSGGQAMPLPDYAARRRRIFGDKVLPNMVLAARAEERW